MTITVSADITTTPPRNTITMSNPAGSVMSSVTLWRNDASGQTLVRTQPSAGFASQVVYDYECPYGVATTYSWSTSYVSSTAITQLWTEPWANLSAWTVTGASWSVVSGKLTWSGVDTPTASVSRALTAGYYRAVLNSPPVGISRVDFGGFYLDTIGYQIVAAGASAPFAPGTGAWTVDMTATNVSVTTTAGTFSLSTVVQATKVAFTGPFQSFTSGAALTVTSGYPLGIAVAANGNIFITTVSNTVAVYSAAGTLLTTFGSAGTGNGQFSGANALAFDSSGNLFVADTGNNRIQKLTVGGTLGAPTLTYASQFGSLGSSNGLLNNPVGIALDSSNNIYVTDQGNNRLQKFTSTGTYSAQVGTLGTGNGQFTNVYGVAVNSAGVVYVMDGTRVQQFSSALAYVSTFPQGSGAGQVYQPQGIALDSNGVLHVVTLYSIVRFNSAGAPLAAIPTPSTIAGNEHSIGISSSGTIYVQNNFSSPQLLTWTRINSSVDVVTVSNYGATVLVNETSAAVTLSPPDLWLIHPIVPGVSFKVKQADATSATLTLIDNITNASNATTHQILGATKPVVTTTGVRGSDTSSISVRTYTTLMESNLAALLLDQTPILINFPPAWNTGFAYGFYQVGDVTRTKTEAIGGHPFRDFTLPITAVQPPVAGVVNTGWSYATLLIGYATYAAVKARFATYLNLFADI